MVINAISVQTVRSKLSVLNMVLCLVASGSVSGQRLGAGKKVTESRLV